MKNHIALFLFILFAVFIFFTVAFKASAQEAGVHVIKGYMTHEDAEFWYHLQTMSDGTEKVHKVAKPKPPNPYISRRIVETNDFPVQVQYVYRVLLQDLTVITNFVSRVKTPRERAVIAVPPVPVPSPLDPEKTDALGLAKKRHRDLKKDGPPAVDKVEIIDTRTMKRTDKAVSSLVKKDHIVYTMESGKEISQPIKKAYTARVASAPISNPSPSDDGGSATRKTTNGKPSIKK